MNKMMMYSLIGLAVIIIAVIAVAEAKKILPVSWQWHNKINQESKLAIKGIDVVAYFSDSQAKQGNTMYNYFWQESEWLFSSQANLDLFKENPEQYAPKYGGYCSFAVSKGFTADIDPKAWQIELGSLYLFNNETIKSDWLKEKSEAIKKADSNWK